MLKTILLSTIISIGIVLVNDYALVYINPPSHTWTKHCPVEPFEWTHTSDERLIDLGGCRYASGKILNIDDNQSNGTGDGDLRITIQLDLSYYRLTGYGNNPVNSLQLEIVPAYRKLGLGNHLSINDHISAIGTWCYDVPHNHNELHPVSWIVKD